MTNIDVADLPEAAIEDYVAQAREFLDASRTYLAGGQLHQASEKGWGAAAHMAKAVALAQGWRYDTHAHFSVVMNEASRRLNDERFRFQRGVPDQLHGNYYRRKRHLNADDIGTDLDGVAYLINLLEPLTAA